MDIIQEYIKVLNSGTELALATSVENKADVRIVSYIFNQHQPGVLYFATQNISTKVAEFLLNENVAFTTIPREGAAHVRSKNTVVKKSAFTITDLKDDFIAKVPGYAHTIEAVGDGLDVYELHIKSAMVVTGYGEPLKLAFTQK